MQLIGRYKVSDRIGEGAMADVYRAHDPSIGRDIAIKVLKAELRQNEEIKGRFLREARAAGALSHPGIVTIYDVGEADGFPYIAMELLDGEPLDELIRRDGKLALKRVLRVGTHLAIALNYAHGLGVVHRDIKPGNIMLCDDGKVVKILDFGIARVGEADRVRAELNMLRTQVGQVLGTPRYMSPEQALGLDIDHRSDLFSLGAVLYEMTTGRPAFNGGSLATIAIQITREKPETVKAHAADCPSGLQFIIEKLLAKQPERRFASGAELAEALKREHHALAHSKTVRKRSLSLQLRLSLMMGAVTAAALGLSIGSVLNRQYSTMERMAVTSGRSIASFVADNVALRAVDNASLPEAQQDWLPVQAFVASAAKDPNLSAIVVSDARGVVRGSNRPGLVGRRYRSAVGGEVVDDEGKAGTSTIEGDALHVRRNILYAGRKFGQIDLTVSKKDLDGAATVARNMLLALAAAILIVVMIVSYGIARLLARPIERLRAALADAAAGRGDFRISHNRSDEFGALFDRFNDLMAAVEARNAGSPAVAASDAGLDATRIDMRVAVPVPVPAPRRLRA
jgi:serine/threonine protein kinase/HAMP domain-containing protein